jgi:mannose-6-phosphate isomerase-like protein (cupin superfamily)
MIKVVQKIWGSEEWLVNTDLYCLKKMIVRPGGMCSFHAHPHKDETFYLVMGKLQVQIEEKVQLLRYSIHIPPMTKHRFWLAPNEREAVFFEVSTHHEDSDVIRYDESRMLV